MAIFGLLALMVPLALVAGACEGIGAMHRRAKEKAEWKHLYSYYYPNGKAWRNEDTCSM